MKQELRRRFPFEYLGVLSQFLREEANGVHNSNTWAALSEVSTSVVNHDLLSESSLV
jgi:hypothetical protein